jgi:acetate kinase
MTHTLILNAGSSSVKFRLYEGDTPLIDGVIDGIGEVATIDITHAGTSSHHKRKVADYDAAAAIILHALPAHPSVIAHRIVHAGAQHIHHEIITPKVMARLTKAVPLAPLHLPPALALIAAFSPRPASRAAGKKKPAHHAHHFHATHIACYDTAFHAAMPAHAARYAIPQKFERTGVRRYGFHGLAHEGMLRAAERLAEKKFPRAITCQLGNGSSVACSKDGKSIDTTMGFTPLEGLMMGTRSGDIDPAAIPYLCTQLKLTPEKVVRILTKESGLLAIAHDHDVRRLLARKDDAARLALAMYCYRVRKAIGSYLAVLGGADLIVLGGGLSRAPRIRHMILDGLEELGVVLDAYTAEAAQPTVISAPVSSIMVLVIEADEQAEMHRIAQSVLAHPHPAHPAVANTPSHPSSPALPPAQERRALRLGRIFSRLTRRR